MAIRLAPARTPRNIMRGTATMVPRFDIANDDHSAYVTDEALNAALRYFAAHGLAAANEARCNAEHAAVHGDDKAYAWWRDICNALDRRMARQLEYKHANAT